MEQGKIEYRLKESDHGMTLKEILREKIKLSSRFIRKLKVEGGLYVNSERLLMHTKLSENDLVLIIFEAEYNDFEPENIPIEIVYEDAYMLVVNKPAGIVVHPTKGHPTGTLANAITYIIQMREQAYKIRFVNRLDRDTSGLLIIAKNAYIQEEFSRQMQSNQVIKKYKALIYGRLEGLEGTIDEPIGRFEEGDIMRQVIEGGKTAITHYRVEENFADQSTLVELLLETGRTHQIRVHLKHIGHPIIGDSLYSDCESEHLIKRQALHADSLEFRHPLSNELIRIKAEMPEDMKTLIDSFRNQSHK